MNIGVSSGCFYPDKTIECVKKVGLTGAEYTEIFFNTDSELDAEYLYALKKIADENRIQIISVHPFTSAIETFMFFAHSDYKLEDSIKYYEKYFKACNILGAKYVVIHGCYSAAEYMDMSRYTAIMNKLSQKRREYDVFISQENVVKFKCGYINNLKEFINHADKNIMFTLDVKQAFRAQQGLYQIMDLMGSRISHIHISDIKDNTDSLIPGKGDVDFKMLFNIAQRKFGVKYRLIEVYNDKMESIEQMTNSIEYLKSL